MGTLNFTTLCLQNNCHKSHIDNLNIHFVTCTKLSNE